MPRFLLVLRGGATLTYGTRYVALAGKQTGGKRDSSANLFMASQQSAALQEDERGDTGIGQQERGMAGSYIVRSEATL